MSRPVDAELADLLRGVVSDGDLLGLIVVRHTPKGLRPGGKHGFAAD